MKTLDLGRRIDLLSMDPHFHDISISIYRSDNGEVATYLLHSYSKRDGTHKRLECLAHIMRTLGGMIPAGGDALSLRFTCGHSHQKALKRLFVEACKAPPGVAPTPRTLSVLDKKNELTVHAEGLGSGLYRCSSDRDGTREQRRVAAIAAGLGKLAELDVEGTKVGFPCASNHHEIVGLLLTRALNVRGALREQEVATTRGVLSAPSQQL